MSFILQESLKVRGFSEFKKNFKGNGRYDFFIDGVEVETVIQNIDRASDGRLFVLLSGARDPSKQPIPKFDRWKWDDKFPGVILNVSDPSFHFDDKKMKIGWYYGTTEKNYSAIISNLVEKVREFFEVQKSDVIFYGSSAGGFASISMSQHIEGSTAVCINPQVYLPSYLKSFYKKFLNVSLGVESDCHLSEDVFLRMDAARIFAKSKNNKCLYVQNVNDKLHYEKHYFYFCEVVGAPVAGGESKKGNVITVPYDGFVGHGPESKGMADKIIGQAISLSNKICG